MFLVKSKLKLFAINKCEMFYGTKHDSIESKFFSCVSPNISSASATGNSDTSNSFCWNQFLFILGGLHEQIRTDSRKSQHFYANNAYWVWKKSASLGTNLVPSLKSCSHIDFSWLLSHLFDSIVVAEEVFYLVWEVGTCNDWGLEKEV